MFSHDPGSVGGLPAASETLERSSEMQHLRLSLEHPLVVHGREAPVWQTWPSYPHPDSSPSTPSCLHSKDRESHSYTWLPFPTSLAAKSHSDWCEVSRICRVCRCDALSGHNHLSPAETGWRVTECQPNIIKSLNYCSRYQVPITLWIKPKHPDSAPRTLQPTSAWPSVSLLHGYPPHIWCSSHRPDIPH